MMNSTALTTPAAPHHGGVLDAGLDAAFVSRYRPACGCTGYGTGHGTSRRGFAALLLGAAVGPSWAAPAKVAADKECKRSIATKFVPAASVEESALVQYSQMMREAQQKGALVAEGDEQLQRLRYIAQRIVPFTVSCNERARDWKWGVELLRSSQVNAFCMPGGKIAFFTGILGRLQLNDHEVAVIMGHEVGHALLEHARERMAKGTGTSIGLRVLSAALGLGTLGDMAAQGTANVLTLKYGRSDESEADALGLLLAARAGFDPRAGVSLWQKMAALKKGKDTPSWLSTHPAGTDRIKDMEKRMPRMLPIYQAAAKPERNFPVAKA
jgi:predicted Zn-dependent protease